MDLGIFSFLILSLDFDMFLFVVCVGCPITK